MYDRHACAYWLGIRTYNSNDNQVHDVVRWSTRYGPPTCVRKEPPLPPSPEKIAFATGLKKLNVDALRTIASKTRSGTEVSLDLGKNELIRLISDVDLSAVSISRQSQTVHQNDVPRAKLGDEYVSTSSLNMLTLDQLRDLVRKYHLFHVRAHVDFFVFGSHRFLTFFSRSEFDYKANPHQTDHEDAPQHRA